MTGERDYSKSAEMGEIATADYAIFTPDNPANDDAAMLVKLLEKVRYDNFIVQTEKKVLFTR